MIPLEHPLVQDYLRAARANPHDASIPRIMLGDRLSELGPFPFIGEPGGLDLETLCWWYAKSGEEDEPALRLALWVIDEWIYGNGERAARVREEHIRRADLERRIAEQPDFHNYVHEQTLAVSWYGSNVMMQSDDPMWMRTKEKARAAAINDLRRRVLALYPEVKYKLSFRISDEEMAMGRDPVERVMNQGMASAGFLSHKGHHYSRHDPENRCTEVWQEFTAPELVPPDGGIDWGRRPTSTPLEDFRAARDRAYREIGY